ncbi:class I SAM-dependent methyltransferase [Bradyrhizobium diazoefficiens]|uniref:TylF/MycF/NovP-related O-methyltransferase n=1 Tax=Bradyrhizobium diazoefficiens TaxID=1355477 RepID=UPI00190A32FA|nr:TylF/MycF/NovP-related O-methyltransferase [Bradyrhizobium diazoefficiens]QQO17512.1 class I SAM-dependent methyltransferase [Bradyrhizobium diazoefficiens]
MLQPANLARFARKVLDQFGLDIARQDTPFLEPEFRSHAAACAPYTMVSRERLYAHFQAIRYVSEHGVSGDIVECGVWRGGVSMLGALTLLSHADASRRIWLYDTFAGMAKPGAEDQSPWDGNNAVRLWSKHKNDGRNDWCYAPLSEVRKNMLSTGYPEDRITFVQGDVVETLGQHVPDKIAVLRLDTDWYASTKAELEILFPRLVKGGVLLIDDYGAWSGCKKAVDEYLSENKIPLMLHRTDYTGRSAIKMTD